MIRRVIKMFPGVKWLGSRLGAGPSRGNDRGFLLDMLPKNSIGAEIGVHLGEFSREILGRVRPKELHLIDPWEHQTSGLYKDAWYGGQATEGQGEMDSRYEQVWNRFATEIQDGQVKIHRDYSKQALESFPDGYFDWVYIDGNHLYEYVMADLVLSAQKTRSGGFVTGDDYVEGGWWKGGVKKAVDEFVVRGSVRLLLIRNMQFVLQKP